MEHPRRTLRRNWPYMLTGTLISVFLWVAVSADTVSEQTLPTDLVIVNADRRFVVTRQEPPTEEVSVVFTGRAGDLALLSMARPRIVVAIDSVDSTVREVSLEPTMVTGRSGNDLVDVRALSVRPERIVLTFERRAQKVVPVIPQVQVTFVDGFVPADSPRAEPGAVAVEGPASALEDVDSVFTVLFPRDSVRQSIDIEAPIAPLDPDGRVTFVPPRVRITWPVEPKAERVFRGIPVTMQGIEAAGLRLEPSLVDIRISGPRSAVEAIRSEALSPLVRLSDAGEVGSPQPVVLPVGNPFLMVEIEPDSARVLRTEEGE